MSDLQAAYLLPQFDCAEEIFADRFVAAATYSLLFKKYPSIIKQANGMVKLLEKHSYWCYAVDAGTYRDKMIEFNKGWKGLPWTKVYPVWELSYKEPALQMKADCPVAERLSNSILQFPTNKVWDLDMFEDALESMHAKES
jgi:dTDP-4-amino-4,6-dideoxygalactose transaminase